jgi:hypothetical protein
MLSDTDTRHGPTDGAGKTLGFRASAVRCSVQRDALQRAHFGVQIPLGILSAEDATVASLAARIGRRPKAMPTRLDAALEARTQAGRSAPAQTAEQTTWFLKYSGLERRRQSGRAHSMPGGPTADAASSNPLAVKSPS